MPNDSVIDTNVLVHAQNPGELRMQDSVALLNFILNSDEEICVDKEYSLEESKNCSLIFSEYYKHVIPGSVAFAFLIQMASLGRIKVISDKVSPATAKKINTMVRNQRDKTFLKVSINSNAKIFISHDFQDFQLPKRKTIEKELGVNIITAYQYIP